MTQSKEAAPVVGCSADGRANDLDEAEPSVVASVLSTYLLHLLFLGS